MLDFINKHWNKYLFYEKEFLSLTDYVAIDTINFKTYSYKLEHLLLGVCAELDAVFREYTRKFTEKMDISDYKREFLKKNPSIISVTIFVEGHREIVLQPFSLWKSRDSLTFWIADNNVKHNRNGGNINANLEAVLNALAAFYYICVLRMDEIYESNKGNCTKNSPEEKSKLFYQNIILEKGNRDAAKKKYQINVDGSEIILIENHLMR